YVETNHGMECLDFLGILTDVQMLEIYKELLRRQEKAAHGFGSGHVEAGEDQKITQALQRFQESKVDDFSSDGIPHTGNTKVSGRLRIQVHLSASGLGITCRILNDGIPGLDALGIDGDTGAALKRGVCRRAGLGLVTGPTGSGKSTTLAAIIDWLRQNHPKHIVTVEDPIEYRYPADMEHPNYPGHRCMAPSIVTQQEVGRDLASYRQGLKDVLRKAPMVILLGEIRDRDAMDTCLEAAQTGHLVLSTLHTTGAVKTMGRILEMYPTERQPAILNRLSEMMIFIHSQGLLKGTEGKRVLTYEFLQNNDDAVASAIANYASGSNSLEDVIRRAGNIAWDDNLQRLFDKGIISGDVFESARMKRTEQDDL
ncbi:MAG: Flp pilus assembly complex ATPase component TadA, partial [Akkermansiaceae bacterium]|nr:Flp pilus assembly complex ATPase component TadA [Akkermansiaceae bacterium]